MHKIIIIIVFIIGLQSTVIAMDYQSLEEDECEEIVDCEDISKSPGKTYRPIGMIDINGKTISNYRAAFKFIRLSNNEKMMYQELPKFMHMHYYQWPHFEQWLNPSKWTIRSEKDRVILHRSYECYKAFNESFKFVANQRLRLFKRRLAWLTGLGVTAASVGSYFSWNTIKKKLLK